METLPAELQIHICSYLSRVDLITLTRTCSSLAAAAKPRLFETLTFHGNDRTDHQHILLRHPCDPYESLPCYPVELASLETAIDKVMELGITKYAKTFQYSPKLYIDDFWPKYRDWVEEQLNERLDAEAMDDESDVWDYDEELDYVGLRSQAEARISRPEREREAIERAELYWNAKFLEQEQRKGSNHAALVRLFRSMPILNSIEMLEWSCAGELQKHGLDGDIDEDVMCQFSNMVVLNLNLETLGTAIQEAGVRIKSLFLPTISGQAIFSTPAVQQLFSALKHLSFDLGDWTEMLARCNGRPPSIQKLIQGTRNTLERLELNNPWESHRLPYRGEHLLEKLWGDDSEQENGALVFPRLKHLQITTLILYAPSLINFLIVQPALQSAVFTNVFVQTQGYGWSHVAAALPPTCQFLRIHRCGGQATPKVVPDPAPHPDIAYSQIPEFRPQIFSWPVSCGWRISDAFIKREAEEQVGRERSIVKQQLIADIGAAQQGLKSSTGMPLSELLSLRRVLERETAEKFNMFKDDTYIRETAEYERIP